MINLESSLAIQVRKQIVEAIAEYQLLEENDKLMVCCSGGKDSSILLVLLKEIQRRAPFDFTLEAVMLDQKQPGFDASAFQEWVAKQEIKLTIVEKDTYSIVKEKVTSGTYCALCSRLRRAVLYDHAVKHQFTKLALGHHRDDINQTLLLNLFYSGKLSSMPPKLKSDDGRNILVRPLMYVAESDLQQLVSGLVSEPVPETRHLGAPRGSHAAGTHTVIFHACLLITLCSLMPATQNVST